MLRNYAVTNSRNKRIRIGSVCSSPDTSRTTQVCKINKPSEFLMATRLGLSVYILVEVLLTWIRYAEAKDLDIIPEKEYNITCVEGCICSDSNSEIYQEKLKVLDCSFRNLHSLPEHIPTDMQVISIRGNSIFKIPDSFADLADLQELDLSGNQLKSIGQGKIFQNMSRLLYLNIGKNSISELFHDTLLGAESLEKLILSENKISNIEERALSDLRNLQSLDLRKNILNSLKKEWFYGLDKLVMLNLAQNKIQKIPASVFRSLSSLEELYLSGNKISSVDPRAFSGLLNLRTLAMDDNLLSRIPTAAFQSLPGLEVLKVDKNPLTKIKPLDFSHLSVTKISMNHMQELSIIDAKAFYNLVNISTIQITNNRKLSYIDPLAFMNTEPLKVLQLNKNNLRGLQKEMQQYLPKTMQLSIGDNPLRCDCNVRWLRKIVSQNEKANLKLADPDHIYCNTPERVKQKLLKNLDIFKLPKLCSPIVLNLTQSQTVAGTLRERQVLECRALGSPIPQLHWILPDGSLVNSTLNEVTRRFFPPGTLVYYHLELSDRGTYTCVAQNGVGSASLTLVLTATGTDIFLYPTRVASTFATLVWNGTDWHGSYKYKIVYNKMNENNTITSTMALNVMKPSSQKITISQLDPHSNYKFCLGYQDHTGYWLETACCYTSTLPIRTNSRGVYQISVSAFIGLLGIVVTLTLFVMCLISTMLRSYRHRLYETPDKSTDSFTIPLVNLYQPLLKGS